MLFSLRKDAANIDQIYRSKSVQVMKDTINKKRMFLTNHTITLERNVMEKFVLDRIKNWKMFLANEECITETEFLLYYKEAPKHKLIGNVYNIKLKPKNRKYQNRIIKDVVFRWEEILKVYPAITQIKGSGLNAKYASDLKIIDWYKEVLRSTFPEHAFELVTIDNYDKRRPKYILYICRKILDYEDYEDTTDYDDSTYSIEDGRYEIL